MRSRTLTTLRRVLPALLLVAAVGCFDDGQPTAPLDSESFDVLELRAQKRGDFTVYTQNVYLGGDTGPIFSIDFSDLPALITATNSFWAEVQASDVPGRVSEIVDELDERRPHLVGLQELFQFVEVEFGSGTPTVASAIDMLASLEGEIAARGLPYEVVAVQANTSTGTAFGLPLSPTRILQFTDRVAVLRRTDVDILASAQGNYGATFALGPLTLKRGWVRVVTEHDGVSYHFVTTHLESQVLAPLQAAQAAELIQGVVAGLDGVTIVTGDLNSDPENPGAPSWTPTYDDMIAAGFTDAWQRSRRSSRGRGFTCCQDSDLRNGMSTLDQRIDFVLVRRSDIRSKSGKVRGSLKVDIVGEEQADRTLATGLWPSDHAGLFATLKLSAAKSNRSGKSRKSRRSRK